VVFKAPFLRSFLSLKKKINKHTLQVCKAAKTNQSLSLQANPQTSGVDEYFVQYKPKYKGNSSQASCNSVSNIRLLLTDSLSYLRAL